MWKLYLNNKIDLEEISQFSNIILTKTSKKIK